MNFLFLIFQNTAVLKVSKKTSAKWVARHEAHKVVMGRLNVLILVPWLEGQTLL